MALLLVLELELELELEQRRVVAPWARPGALVFVPHSKPPCTVQGASSKDQRDLLSWQCRSRVERVCQRVLKRGL